MGGLGNPNCSESPVIFQFAHFSDPRYNRYNRYNYSEQEDVTEFPSYLWLKNADCTNPNRVQPEDSTTSEHGGSILSDGGPLGYHWNASNDHQ